MSVSPVNTKKGRETRDPCFSKFRHPRAGGDPATYSLRLNRTPKLTRLSPVGGIGSAMTYPDAFRRRFQVSHLTLADWSVLSFAVAIAVAIAIMLFGLVNWAIGWVMPQASFGLENPLADIALASAMSAVSLFLFNLLGAAVLRIFFHLVKLAQTRRGGA
jgi:hypothetical protein